MDEADNPILAGVDLLRRFGVDNVLIGGTAALIHGANVVTQDVDFCAEWSFANLQRLAEALNAAGARLRVEGVPEGVAAEFDVGYLRQFSSIATITDQGFLDIRKSVDGIGDYASVMALSEVHRIGSRDIRVLSLAGIIQSKRAMGRDRDRAVLPTLEAVQEARDAERRSQERDRGSRGRS